MAPGVAAALQIFGDVFHAPGFQAAALGAVQPRREHAVDASAAVGLAVFVRAEQVLRRMAGAAMRDALDQIAAAIPLRALLLVRHQNAGLEEQPVPAAHHDAIVERPAQLGRTRRMAHRRQRRQIGADGENVLARQFREIRIGESRVIARTVARHAQAQSAVERVIAPGAQARLAVRRQIGRVDAAERGVDPLAPGERFCGIGGMAACAVAGVGQRLAARDILSRRRFALGLGMAFGNGERSAQKHPSENRPHRLAWSLHHLASWGVIARKRTEEECHAVSRRGSRTTQTEKRCRYSRHEIAIFESAASGARFVVRGQENPT